jgi:hypothetical protein
VADIQKQRLTDEEKAQALDFDDDALVGDVQERLIFTVIKTEMATGAQA